MAIINSYDTLKTAIADYLARDDLTGFIENFIQNCEHKLYRRLRIRAMETSFTGTTSGGSIALPTRYVSLKNAYINNTPVVWMERVPAETIYREYPNRAAGGIPIMIAQEANTFIFGPNATDDLVVKGVYYQRPELLHVNPSGNWFVNNSPDVLLYGSLLEAEAFIARDARLPIWAQAYEQSIALMEDAELMERGSGSQLAVRRV